INPRNELALESYFWYRLRLNSSDGAWQCPFCQARGRPLDDACPDCGAILSLADLAAFVAQRPLRREKIEAALVRLAKAAPDFATHYQLGLGHLNLSRLPEAIHCFEAAHGCVPEFPRLETQLAVLRERQRAAEEELRRQR